MRWFLGNWWDRLPRHLRIRLGLGLLLAAGLWLFVLVQWLTGR